MKTIISLPCLVLFCLSIQIARSQQSEPFVINLSEELRSEGHDYSLQLIPLTDQNVNQGSVSDVIHLLKMIRDQSEAPHQNYASDDQLQIRSELIFVDRQWLGKLLQQEDISDQDKVAILSLYRQHIDKELLTK